MQRYFSGRGYSSEHCAVQCRALPAGSAPAAKFRKSCHGTNCSSGCCELPATSQADADFSSGLEKRWAKRIGYAWCETRRCNAASTRSGVIGMRVTRTPVARAMALATAAAGGTIGTSPTPRTP